jgi:hypothetical protein
LYRWGLQVHGWPYQLANRPGERGFGVHYMGGAAWGGHPCPEALRAAQRPRILSLAAGGIPTDQEDDMAGYADQLNRIEMFSSSAHTQAGAAFSFMAPTIGAAVEQFYEQYLGRKPSEHDVDAWVAEVVTKSRTRAQLEAAIAGSPEAKARAKA